MVFKKLALLILTKLNGKKDMKIIIIGIILLIAVFAAGVYLKINSSHDYGLAIFGLMIAAAYLGAMLALDAFNKSNRNT